jgi:serine/threonine protein kinase
LRKNKIRHKDIKPRNILLKKNEIYITDFGKAIEFDGDKSMTKGTVRARTTQYHSPEVSRGTKRGIASDIWLLGVTFLEMTTVLRGQTLEAMQSFLRKNGTCDEYVFENIQGAMKWPEYLRKDTKYPRIDNFTYAMDQRHAGRESDRAPECRQFVSQHQTSCR